MNAKDPRLGQTNARKQRPVNEWTLNNKIITELPSTVVGFVYLIECITLNKKYIGKKLTHFKRSKPPLKGRTNKRHTRVSSDWLTYWGSSDSLTEDIKRLGLSNFKRTILHTCSSKSQCNYLEAKEQFARCVLERSDYYNNNIQVRVHGSHILNKQP